MSFIECHCKYKVPYEKTVGSLEFFKVQDASSLMTKQWLYALSGQSTVLLKQVAATIWIQSLLTLPPW